MTRIVAGSAKGVTLRVPRSGTRPTSEKVREALVGSLEHRGYIAGCRVADLFAGSGAVALEAKSRGAAAVVAVEAARQAADVIHANARATGLDIAIRREKAETWAAGYSGAAFDLIFLDPPYAYPEAKLAALLAALGEHLEADGAVVVERDSHSPEPTWPTGWELLDARSFGDTRVWTARPDRVEA